MLGSGVRAEQTSARCRLLPSIFWFTAKNTAEIAFEVDLYHL